MTSTPLAKTGVAIGQVSVVSSLGPTSLEQTSVTRLETSQVTLREEDSRVAERVHDTLDDLRSLYPHPSTRLERFITVVTEAIELCKAGIESEERCERFRADDYLLKVQALLAELMKAQTMEGPAIVAGAITFGIINRHGKPLNVAEMSAILRSLNGIRLAPFCSVDEAVTMTEILESAGFTVDPPPLAEFLTDAQEAGFVET